MQDQRFSVDIGEITPHRPNVVGRQPLHREEIVLVAADMRSWHHAPPGAIPVERVAQPVHVSRGPYIVRRDCGYAVDLVLVVAGDARAGHDAPLAAVPM